MVMKPFKCKEHLSRTSIYKPTSSINFDMTDNLYFSKAKEVHPNTKHTDYNQNPD